MSDFAFATSKTSITPSPLTSPIILLTEGLVTSLVFPATVPPPVTTFDAVPSTAPLAASI